MLKINLNADENQTEAQERFKLDEGTRTTTLHSIYDPDINHYEEKKYGELIPQADANWVKAEIAEDELAEIMTEAQKNFDELQKQITTDLEAEADNQKLTGTAKTEFMDAGKKTTEELFSLSGVMADSLEKLPAPPEVRDVIASGLFLQLQDEINLHLAQVFPDTVFEALDGLLEQGDIDELKLSAVLAFYYKALTGQPITGFINDRARELADQTIESYSKLTAQYQTVAKMSETDQQKFIEFMEAGDTAGAEDFIASQLSVPTQPQLSETL